MRTVTSIPRFVFRGGMALLLAWTLSAAIFAQTSGDVFITGRVSNAATRASLEGAIVRLEGTPHSVATERDGTYLLRVPAGNYQLTVSYTGLDPQTVSLVADGGTERQDVALTAAIYRMDTFTVSTEREGSALAATLRRQAPNVKDVVSADAFGNMAGNPAELLGRLPGIVADSGLEGRYVAVRGMENIMTSVNIDGNKMANAGSAGNTREFQFELTGVDRIERIEVTKAPTPDMDADSIGGVVNFVSKNAFDGPGERRVRASAGYIWRPSYTMGGVRMDKPRKNWTLSYSEVFKEKIGVSFDWGSRQSLLALDVGSQDYSGGDPGDTPFLSEYEYEDFKITRTRAGGGLRLDYKLNSNVRFFINGQYNKHIEYEDDNFVVFSTDDEVATRRPDGTYTGGGVLPGFTTDFHEWRAISDTEVELGSTSTLKGGRLENYQIGGVHKYRTWSFDYDAFKSVGITDYPGNAVFTYTLNNVGLQFDGRNRDRYYPAVIQTAGADITNIDNYRDNVLNIDIKRGDDEYQGVAFNFRKDFSTTAPIWIKGGLRLRTQTRELSRPRVRWRYAGPDRVLNSGDENLRQFMNMSVKTNGPVILPFPARTFRDAPGTSYDYAGYNVGSVFRSDRSLFVEDIAFNVSNEQLGRQSFEEEINAAYVMGNVTLGRLSVLGGLRFEETKTWGEGSLRQVTPEERARRAAWQGPVTPAELRRRTLEEYHRRDTATGSYDNVFPGLHLKFEPVRGLVGRLSYSTNIGRPTIGNIVPSTTVNVESRTISTSNPSLLPQFADNFDAGLEYYYEPAGMVSIGGFWKDISDFHFSQGGIVVGTGADNGFDGDYAGYTLSTRRNGGSATVKGIELAWQQQFSFLPGWLSGFGAFANYTRLRAEGDYGGTQTLSTNQITNFVPEAANVGISYIRTPFSIRVQLKHRGKFLDDYNDDPDRLIWMLPQTVVDIKTQYNINERFGLYMDIFNIFNDPNREFEWGSGRPQNLRKDSVMFLFGVNARL